MKALKIINYKNTKHQNNTYLEKEKARHNGEARKTNRYIIHLDGRYNDKRYQRKPGKQNDKKTH